MSTTASSPAATVVDRTGVVLRDAGGPGDADPRVLLGLALRRNPRRAQLLVSRVLGKHVPTDPRLVRAAGLLLGARVADVLDDRAPRALPVDLLHAAVRGGRDAAAAVHAAAAHAVGQAGSGTAHDVAVLGFAETATALGHCVAEALHADYLHSTRRPVEGIATAGGFTEEHSHATDHLLLPADAAFLTTPRPLVLVDDELSTGRTAFNTIAALHRLCPRERYVLAALVDSRPHDSDLVASVAALGARLDVVSLARAAIVLPADLTARAGALRAVIDAAPGTGPTEPGTPARDVPRVRLTDLGWPAETPDGGRHGFGPAEHDRLAAALPGLAASLGDATALDGRVLVLGTEELMALPLRIAQTLADAGHDIAFSTTTRSPAVVVDDPGYALTSGITFPAHDDPADGPGPRYAYNVGGPTDPRWDHVLVVVDPPADTAALDAGLLAALAPRTQALTVVVTP
ncbi:phosphoribosyltransferase family protein [Pseudonocardia sp. N23]|uniref:phosphoribosyltransferase family protein n=1 Tax=Pseudonocardia sp. N23 TaxID=1987376 RepID=UPI000C024BD1|nr:phosphoribosyltransferase family protein [Pseudonocardia sp. N23]GAY11680.1 adenine/guanine phosphoribosyltransferase [Pseudonocardia sp. N23]